MIIFRKDRLVYLAIEKHASTFHKQLFTELGWSIEESIINIDWDNDVVFAHFMNPLERHIKATAEAIYRHKLEKIFNDSHLAKILAWGILDYHAVPVVASLGEEICNQIDWIPLDGPVEANILTSKFLQYHDIGIDITTRPKEYVSNAIKDEYVKVIRHLIEQNGTGGGVNMFYRRDFNFYIRMKSRFNFGGNTWNEMTWLRGTQKAKRNEQTTV